MSGDGRLRGKRAAVVLFSYYPMDPRPRRAAEALVNEGMKVDLICLREASTDPKQETVNGVEIRRVPLRRRRGGVLGYLWQYATFLVVALGILAARSLTRRYHLVHVHNMPDILVLSALIPKLLGAKVILDLHDPMPELMMTIFRLDRESRAVGMLRRLEKWSIRWADLVLTTNLAFERLFVSRGCRPEKIRIVMNAPDEKIFGSRPADPTAATTRAPGKPFVVMYHGSLLDRNGVDVAVEAVARVRQSVADVELRIYGAPTPFLEQVMESVHAQGLTDAVRFLGAKRLEEIVEAIKDCDVGVIPNRRSVFTELNMPTRIFEYLAVGKPVIAPRAAGILDYFDEESLMFFELGDADDLARRIQDTWADPGKAAAIARRGQQVYRAHAWCRERNVLVGAVEGVLRPRRQRS
ncbi:MAG TPA: glycosyltransferase family 4 protein [Candidatus Acidoferrum sp.]|nr:glycosyltransferase family 4 protein [Candidatus Acidoferrum sp.]